MQIEQYERVVMAILLGDIKQLAPNKILAAGFVIYTRKDHARNDDDEEISTGEYIEYYSTPSGRHTSRTDWFLTIDLNAENEFDGDGNEDNRKIYMDWSHVSITIDSNLDIEYCSSNNKKYPITCDEDIFSISLLDVNLPAIDYNFLCNLTTTIKESNKKIYIWPEDYRNGEKYHGE